MDGAPPTSVVGGVKGFPLKVPTGTGAWIFVIFVWGFFLEFFFCSMNNGEWALGGLRGGKGGGREMVTRVRGMLSRRDG